MKSRSRLKCRGRGFEVEVEVKKSKSRLKSRGQGFEVEVEVKKSRLKSRKNYVNYSFTNIFPLCIFTSFYMFTAVFTEIVTEENVNETLTFSSVTIMSPFI